MPAPRPADGQLLLDVRSCTPTVMGHEFSGEVAERGAKTPKSFPMVRAHGGVQLTGLSPLAPGGYDVPGAERAVHGHRGTDTLHMLADGKLKASPLVTGKVGWPVLRRPSRRWATRKPTRRSSSIPAATPRLSNCPWPPSRRS
jgi:hypothetical protein